MQPEAKLQSAIVRAIEKEGHFCIKQRLQGRAGWPDLYCVLKGGRACHIEVKMPGEDPTPLQVHMIEKLREAGAVTGWCSSVEEAIQIVRSA